MTQRHMQSTCPTAATSTSISAHPRALRSLPSSQAQHNTTMLLELRMMPGQPAVVLGPVPFHHLQTIGDSLLQVVVLQNLAALVAVQRFGRNVTHSSNLHRNRKQFPSRNGMFGLWPQIQIATRLTPLRLENRRPNPPLEKCFGHP